MPNIRRAVYNENLERQIRKIHKKFYENVNEPLTITGELMEINLSLKTKDALEELSRSLYMFPSWNKST